MILLRFVYIKKIAGNGKNVKWEDWGKNEIKANNIYQKYGRATPD